MCVCIFIYIYIYIYIYAEFAWLLSSQQHFNVKPLHKTL